jgi:uncharacterized protein (UPF0179 family)
MELIKENIIKPKKNYKKRVNPYEITYENFTRYNLDLKRYKITDLKEAAKQCSVKITGTKPILIERISTKYGRITKAIEIQKIFRGWLIRSIMKAKGPAMKDRSICTNETDCCTLEPLDEISIYEFYSYTDKSNFTYGFNITSLIEIYKRKHIIKNPYNREKFGSAQTKNIIKLFNANFSLVPTYKDEYEPVKLNEQNNHTRRYTANHIRNIRERGVNRIYRQRNNNALNDANMSYLQRSSRMLRMEMAELEEHSDLIVNERNSIVSSLINRVDTDINRHLNNLMTTLPSEIITRYNNLQERQRTSTLNDRVRQLFLEIDSLGNYTNEIWFTNLTFEQYKILLRVLYEIWENRGLTHQLKSRISPFKWPFDHIYERGFQNIETISMDIIQKDLITALELMIFTGTDNDSRNIGAMHVLSALTLVSREARSAVPWLYESVLPLRTQRINHIPY